MSANALAEPEEQIGPEEVIKWLEEHAFKTGKIRFSTVFKPDEIAELVNIDAGSTTSPSYQVPPSVQSELEANKVELERYMKVYKYLQRHTGVLREAEAIMERRLLAAGMSKEELAKRNKKGFSPRTKVIKLYNLENPPAKEPKRMKVHLLKQNETGCETQDIYLSVKDTLDDLKADLDNLSATVSGRSEHIPNRGKGAWMYQIVEGMPSTNNRLPPPAVSPRKRLLVNADYQDLVKTLTKKGRKAKSAMLFQESTLKFQRDLLTMEAKDNVWTGGLDEQGLPYLQDPDWAMLIKKHFGDATEEEKGVAQSTHGSTENVHDRATSSNDSTKTANGKGIGLRSVTAPIGYGNSAHGNAESVGGNGQPSNGNTTGINGQMDEPKHHDEGTNGHAEKSANGQLGRGKNKGKSAQCGGKAKSNQAPILETPRRSDRIKKKSSVKNA